MEESKLKSLQIGIGLLLIKLPIVHLKLSYIMYLQIRLRVHRGSHGQMVRESDS